MCIGEVIRLPGRSNGCVIIGGVCALVHQIAPFSADDSILHHRIMKGGKVYDQGDDFTVPLTLRGITRAEWPGVPFKQYGWRRANTVSSWNGIRQYMVEKSPIIRHFAQIRGPFFCADCTKDGRVNSQKGCSCC